MKETWRELITRMTWPQFREWVLDHDPLQTVNLPWWKGEYDRIREESAQ